jgi:hypothetical protein
MTDIEYFLFGAAFAFGIKVLIAVADVLEETIGKNN